MVTNSLIISSCSSLHSSNFPKIPNPNSTFLFKPLISNPPSLQFSTKPTRIHRISSANFNSVIAEAKSIESEQQIVAASSNDGFANVISVLLLLAFLGLSVLTIGVIYIAVTDYLQKREKEKFEKDEATNKKKKGKKKIKARISPKGFGQKLIDDDEDFP